MVRLIAFVCLIFASAEAHAQSRAACREQVYVEHRGETCRSYSHVHNASHPDHYRCRINPGAEWNRMKDQIDSCEAAGGLRRWLSQRRASLN